MALSNAEKQARYRERHLGVDGGKRRLTHFIDAATGVTEWHGIKITP